MSGFGADLEAFARATKIRMDKVERKIAFDLTSDFVRGNPVDTGHARSNWFIGSTRDASVENRTVKSGSPSLNRAAVFASTHHAGVDYYITNNVPYILPLEYGSSKQAPVGWVRSTVSRWQKLVDRVVHEVAQ